jgi:hypothetical protein
MGNPNYSNFFYLIRAYSLAIKNGRTISDVHDSIKEEREELDLEISGNGDGRDGIMGEAIDEIASVTDLIFLSNPDVTETQFMDYLSVKLEKWRTKYSDASFEEVLAQLPQPPCETASQVADAKEIFNFAQLSSDEKDSDAEKRILDYLQHRDQRLFHAKNDAIENALGILDTPLGRRRLGTNAVTGLPTDGFYKEVIDTLKNALK